MNSTNRRKETETPKRPAEEAKRGDRQGERVQPISGRSVSRALQHVRTLADVAMVRAPLASRSGSKARFARAATGSEVRGPERDRLGTSGGARNLAQEAAPPRLNTAPLTSHLLPILPRVSSMDLPRARSICQAIHLPFASDTFRRLPQLSRPTVQNFSAAQPKFLGTQESLTNACRRPGKKKKGRLRIDTPVSKGRNSTYISALTSRPRTYLLKDPESDPEELSNPRLLATVWSECALE